MHHISLIACLVGSAVNGAKKKCLQYLGPHIGLNVNATKFKKAWVMYDAMYGP
jgi:hypothetical protein